MNVEFDRLFTYPQKWPFGYNKEDLAREGLFSVSGSNTVECFACKIRINVQIQEATTVMDRHKERNPDCPMNVNPAAVKNISLKHTNVYK